MYRGYTYLMGTFIIVLLFFLACNSKDGQGDESQILSDDSLVTGGEHSFAQDCSPCHNFRQDGIGPQLAGLTKEVSPDWIKRFIKNPKEVIESGDDRAKALFEKYHVYMPSFGWYSESQLDRLVAFIHSHSEPEKVVKGNDPPGDLQNPVPEVVELSPLIVDLEMITQVAASAERPPLARITKMIPIPGSDRLFINDLRGKMYEIIGSEAREYFDIASVRPEFVHQLGLAGGFGSFAFHPEFLENGLFYTTHNEPENTQPADFSYDDSINVRVQWVLTEWKSPNPSAKQFSGEGRELFRIDVPSQIHGVQEITFNPTVKKGDPDYGLLYIAIGDGGAVENGYRHLVQNTSLPWGCILRIDPSGNNSRNKKYGIPSDNPFSNDQDKLGEIYALGFRNPHRLTWDQKGRLFASCIGHHKIEEINLIEPGKNYGWPFREGTFLMYPDINMSKVYPLPSDDQESGFTYPIAQYDHEEGAAITGGYEYRGELLPALSGKFIFGDIVRGRLFYIELDDVKQGEQTSIYEWQVRFQGNILSLRELCGHDRVDLRFGRDADGEMYLFTKADGKIYKFSGIEVNL